MSKSPIYYDIMPLVMTTPERQRGGTQPSPITLDQLVAAALRIVERSSLDQLTVRAVAQECGVTAPAVHYHLRGGAALADRVVEAVTRTIEIHLNPAATWVEQYVSLVIDMDRAFLRYPGTGLRALSAAGASGGATRLTQTALEILRQGGFEEAEAREVFTATYLLFAGWLATRGLAERGEVHPALRASGRLSPGFDDADALEAALRRILPSTPTNSSEGNAR